MKTGIKTCCRNCAHYGGAWDIAEYNRKAMKSRRLPCPPRNTPCGEQPGSKKCLGDACGACEGFKEKKK